MEGQLVRFTEKLDKSLISRFNGGRHDPSMKWAAEKAYALAAIEKNEALQNCSPASFQMAMLDVAWSGLSLSPVTAHGYLIPYKGTMTFRPSYRGLEHLCYRAGTIKSIQSNVVRQGDKFEVETRDNRRIITHVERGDSNRKISHAYAILHFTNGGEYVEVMDRPQLDAVEAQAKASKGGGAVWNGPWYSEMCRKAVLRRGLKHAPLDNGGNLAHAIAVNDKLDPIDFDRGTPVEREAVEELATKEQILKLHAYLTDNGITEKEADYWLNMLSDALGIDHIDNLPAKHVEEAERRLKARFAEWQKKHGKQS